MVSKKSSVLIVDDEQVVCDLLYEELTERDYLCSTALNGNNALTKLATNDFDVVLLDIKLPGMSGMEVLRELWANHNNAVAIVITAINDVDTAVEAMKIGAVDYITKPFELERVNDSIERALQKMPVWRNKSAPHGDSAEARGNLEGCANHLDAIARGVEIKLESLTSQAMTMTVIEKTVGIARNLDIPEDEIEKWADTTLKENAERIKAMDSLVKKLERNPIAQIVLGISDLYQYPPGHENCLN